MPVFALPPYFRNDLLHTQHYSRIPNQRRNLYHTQLRIEYCQCWNTRFLLDLEVPFSPANSISAICLLLLFNPETGILQSGNYLFGYAPGNGHFGDAMPQTCALSDVHLSDFQIGFADDAVDGFLNDVVIIYSFSILHRNAFQFLFTHSFIRRKLYSPSFVIRHTCVP